MRKPLSQLRAKMRRALHAQLDANLNLTSTLPDGSQGTVLDDLCVRSLHGYGVAIDLSCRHPAQPGTTPVVGSTDA